MTKKLFLSLIVPILVIIFRPFGIDFNQSIILGSLIFTIISWVSGVLSKNITSIFLLTIFILFGNTELKKIFSFPLSPNFLLIIFSFLFSQGIANSKLAEKLFQPLLIKYTDNVVKLVVSMVVFSTILIFIIPQNFSRVIILSFMYYEYFTKIGLDNKAKEVLLFGVYTFSLYAHLFFKRADLILNYSILSVGNVTLTESGWIKYMTVPSIFMTALGLGIFLFVFRKELKSYNPGNMKIDLSNTTLSRDDKINLWIIIIIVLLWASEEFHGISGNIIVILGTLFMYLRKNLNKEDLKSVNIELLIFLTAAFSIGSVMKGSGIADVVFKSFTKFFPSTFSIKYALIIMITTMSLHMVLGSNITTMSVVIPSLVAISSGVVSNPILVFIVHMSYAVHYIVPFHNVLIAVGEGNNYYKSDVVIRYGLIMTLITFIGVILFYIPWWKFIGAL